MPVERRQHPVGPAVEDDLDAPRVVAADVAEDLGDPARVGLGEAEVRLARTAAVRADDHSVRLDLGRRVGVGGRGREQDGQAGERAHGVLHT